MRESLHKHVIDQSYFSRAPQRFNRHIARCNLVHALREDQNTIASFFSRHPKTLALGLGACRKSEKGSRLLWRRLVWRRLHRRRGYLTPATLGRKKRGFAGDVATYTLNNFLQVPAYLVVVSCFLFLENISHLFHVCTRSLPLSCEKLPVPSGPPLRVITFFGVYELGADQHVLDAFCAREFACREEHP